MQTKEKTQTEMLKDYKPENSLDEHVKDYILDRVSDYDYSVLSFLEDLQHGGCQSGLIGELIYYDDTVKFFENYKEEINELLKELMESTGLSIEDLFGDKWDKEDPLIMDRFNKNLLAWFGFEETAFKIGRELFPEDF